MGNALEDLLEYWGSVRNEAQAGLQSYDLTLKPYETTLCESNTVRYVPRILYVEAAANLPQPEPRVPCPRRT